MALKEFAVIGGRVAGRREDCTPKSFAEEPLKVCHAQRRSVDRLSVQSVFVAEPSTVCPFAATLEYMPVVRNSVGLARK